MLVGNQLVSAQTSRKSEQFFTQMRKGKTIKKVHHLEHKIQELEVRFERQNQ